MEAIPGDAGVAADAQNVLTPQMDPQGRNTKGRAIYFPSSFSTQLTGTCCSQKSQVRGRLCYGGHRQDPLVDISPEEQLWYSRTSRAGPTEES